MRPQPALANQQKDSDIASLASLKSQQKRDKGPSEGNLSSLRESLLAVTASQPKVAGATATPRTESTSLKDEKKTEGTKIVRDAQQVTPLKPGVTSPPPPLLSDMNDTKAREVPENVLMGVLAN